MNDSNSPLDFTPTNKDILINRSKAFLVNLALDDSYDQHGEVLNALVESIAKELSWDWEQDEAFEKYCLKANSYDVLQWVLDFKLESIAWPASVHDSVSIERRIIQNIENISKTIEGNSFSQFYIDTCKIKLNEYKDALAQSREDRRQLLSSYQ